MTSDLPLPLAGIRAVCVAVYVPAPVAAARLRGLGAAVTKVEPPGGDPLALASPAWYAALCEGQDVVRLDLKDRDGRERLEALLGEADLLLTAIRPGALERLGLGSHSLRERHPRLCHVAIVGHPAPEGERPGHDLTYQAQLGLVAPPAMPRTLLADLAGAERAASEALALLVARERGGGVGRAEVALSAAAESFAAPLRRGLTAPGGLLGGALATYALYRTREGWLALAALEPHFEERLRAALGLADPRAPLTRELLESAFAGETAEHWEHRAREWGVPMVRVS